MLNILQEKIIQYEDLIKTRDERVTDFYYHLERISYHIFEKIDCDYSLWVCSEIASYYKLVTDENIVFRNESAKALVKFELINSYLSKKNVSGIKISNCLYDLLVYYYSNKKEYLAFKIISLLINFSELNQTTIKVLNMIFDKYLEDGEINDKTVLFEFQIYINEYFEGKEKNEFISKYKDIWDKSLFQSPAP
jgi:hypothetical protein